MQINTFRAIRFGADYWNRRNQFEISNSNDKITQIKNTLSYISSQIAKGVAKIDAVPGLYILRTTSSLKRVTSVIGEIDYNEKSVLFMNEGIHPQKLKCYKTMFQQFKIQTSPVLTFYKNNISIEAIVGDLLRHTPTSTTSFDGTLYELWYINTPLEIGKIKQSLKSIERLYIADGHHRFSLFTNVVSKLSAKLIISVTDANSILLKSCHRVICGAISQNWYEKVFQFGHIEKINSFDNTVGKVVLAFQNGENFAVDCSGHGDENSLFDIVKNDIIKFGFGIKNYDENVFPLPGNISPGDVRKIFDLYKNAAVVIFVPSIDISEFLDVIDNGHKLPATSTWFEPKIMDGFIVGKFQ